MNDETKAGEDEAVTKRKQETAPFAAVVAAAFYAFGPRGPGGLATAFNEAEDFVAFADKRLGVGWREKL